MIHKIMKDILCDFLFFLLFLQYKSNYEDEKRNNSDIYHTALLQLW